MVKTIDDEIDLKEYLAVLSSRWKIIAYITVGIAILALFYSLIQKPVFEAKTTIFVRSSSSSSLSQLSSLAGIAGINLPSSSGTLDDLNNILQSRSVAEKVIEDLNLTNRIPDWNNPKLTHLQLIAALQGMLKKPRIDGNMATITVSNNDPAMAADIANGYLDALSYYWNRLNFTEAGNKRDYIEKQLPVVEAKLKESEQRYKAYTLLGGSKLNGVEVIRLQREMEIQNTVYTMLRKEYETVKLEASKEIPPFSVVDRAVKPEVKSSPKVKFNTIIGLVLGVCIGIFIAFLQEYWEKPVATK